uniref:Putative secreted protein n=1 Tax=Anopheles darlingi TaxID=43151 RepID=A0A2M4D6R0_ANODA
MQEWFLYLLCLLHNPHTHWSGDCYANVDNPQRNALFFGEFISLFQLSFCAFQLPHQKEAPHKERYPSIRC